MYENDDDTQLTAPVANDPCEIPEMEYWTLDDFPELTLS